MSDFGIVGMGLVHIQSALFVLKADKMSTCDLECSFFANSINIFFTIFIEVFRYIKS